MIEEIPKTIKIYLLLSKDVIGNFHFSAVLIFRAIIL